MFASFRALGGDATIIFDISRGHNRARFTMSQHYVCTPGGDHLLLRELPYLRRLNPGVRFEGFSGLYRRMDEHSSIGFISA
jgi:hypothetical protein